MTSSQKLQSRRAERHLDRARKHPHTAFVLHRLPASLILVVTACLWSMGGVFIKSVDASALAIAGMRSLFAGVTLFILFKEVRRWPRRTHLWGALAYTVTVLSFVSATRMTTAANAIFLQSTAPLYVFLISWLILKERPPRMDVVFMPVIVLGMSLFFLGDLELNNLMGLWMAAGSGVAFAVFLSLMRHQRSQTPLTSIFFGNIVTALICLPFLLNARLGGGDVGLLAFLGAIQLALPYYLYSRTVDRLSAVDTSLILLLEPILNPLWVYWHLGEVPDPMSLWGGALVILTVGIRTLWLAKGRRENVAPISA